MQAHVNMEPLKEMVHAGKQAFSKGPAEKSEHLNLWKKHMTKAVGTSVGALVLGGMAVVALKKALDAAHQHKDWKDKDSLLDERLESSLDASDAVASY